MSKVQKDESLSWEGYGLLFFAGQTIILVCELQPVSANRTVAPCILFPLGSFPSGKLK